MAVSTNDIIDILGAYGVVPEERLETPDLPAAPGGDFPDTGDISEGETVYATSLSEVFREDETEHAEVFGADDPRIQEWMNEIDGTIRWVRERSQTAVRARQAFSGSRIEPPEPHCAWYCPIHFFGQGWGIYIREQCILSITKEIAWYIDWSAVHASQPSIARQLLRSAFYVFFLHEQFHHKVESLGLRFLISTGSDRYRPYKARVYRPTYLTADCLEESLANAESYNRLAEERYKIRVEQAIRDGLRSFLKVSFSRQPPGYRESLNYLGLAYREGLYKLQSQALNCAVSPNTPMKHWAVAPNVITALMDVTDDIYVVLPIGARPIFRPTSVDPGWTASTYDVVGALTKRYGYQVVPGGKGSHVKLKKPNSETIILPGNRAVLTPGAIKNVLDKFGKIPISKLKEFLEGELPS